MIYFIRDRRDSRIKIGLSRDPWQRMRELAVTAPDSLELLAVTLFQNAELGGAQAQSTAAANPAQAEVKNAAE